KIAGHGCDDLDPLAREKFREILLSRHVQDGQVAAVHHANAHLARGAYQATEVRIELGRAAGDVEGRNAPPLEESEHHVAYPAGRFLAAMRVGVEVAVHARLIAAVADIDLQRVEPPAPDRREREVFKQWPSVAHVLAR